MYTCTICQKNMFSVTEGVERSGEIYCKQCDPDAAPQTSAQAKNPTQRSESREPESKQTPLSEDQVLAIFDKKIKERGWAPEMQRLAREDFRRSLNEKMKEEKKQGCLIATAACGSSAAPAVITLRDFRDKVLERYYIGRVMIKSYTRIAPSIARWIAPSARARWLVRTLLVVPLASLVRCLRG